MPKRAKEKCYLNSGQFERPVTGPACLSPRRQARRALWREGAWRPDPGLPAGPRPGSAAPQAGLRGALPGCRQAPGAGRAQDWPGPADLAGCPRQAWVPAMPILPGQPLLQPGKPWPAAGSGQGCLRASGRPQGPGQARQPGRRPAGRRARRPAVQAAVPGPLHPPLPSPFRAGARRGQDRQGLPWQARLPPRRGPGRRRRPRPAPLQQSPGRARPAAGSWRKAAFLHSFRPGQAGRRQACPAGPAPAGAGAQGRVPPAGARGPALPAGERAPALRAAGRRGGSWRRRAWPADLRQRLPGCA